VCSPGAVGCGVLARVRSVSDWAVISASPHVCYGIQIFDPRAGKDSQTGRRQLAPSQEQKRRNARKGALLYIVLFVVLLAVTISADSCAGEEFRVRDRATSPRASLWSA
jgi:hypothetical protein